MLKGKGRLRSPKRGPKVNLSSTWVNSLGPNSIAAPIWITLVVQKRKGLDRRLKATAKLFRPLKTTTTTVVVHVKKTKVVSLTDFRRTRSIAKTKFTKVYGTKTTKVKPSSAKKIVFAAMQRMQRKYITKSVKQTKVFGRPTKTVQPRSPKIIHQVGKTRTKGKIIRVSPIRSTVVVVAQKLVKAIKILNQAMSFSRKRHRGTVKYTKRYGKSTTRTIVRPPKVLTFANQVATRKRRYVPVKIIIVKPNPVANPTGSTVTLYGALWMADGLMYHQGLSRPTLVLTPVSGGKFTVVKTSGLSDELADQLDKQVIIIDGNLP